MKKTPKILLNLLVAIAISLVVNFSMLLVAVTDTGDPMEMMAKGGGGTRGGKFPPMRGVFVEVEHNGSGFMIAERGDSVYVPSSRVKHYELKAGDRLTVVAMKSRQFNMVHPSVVDVVEINGRKINELSSVRSRSWIGFVVQFIYYFVLSLVVVVIVTAFGTRRSTRLSLVRRYGLAIFVAMLLFLLAPVSVPRRGDITFNFLGHRILDYMQLLKWSFALVVSLLYGEIYRLFAQRQRMTLENEQLKTENITTRYNMLMSQINPHFFFNSLNSLSMLVREGSQDKSLTYIDQLSYTFRYIIQNGESRMTTLGDELKFAEAYSYLFKIRYADKLDFKVDVDPQYLSWHLPSLTLQPLLDNAVKHNTITRANPFCVEIFTQGSKLIVQNKIVPKLEPEPSTGIGLDNLRKRWLLITDCEVVVDRSEQMFRVVMPLIKPSKN